MSCRSAVALIPASALIRLLAIQHGGRPPLYEASDGHRQTAIFAPDDNARHNTYQWNFVMPDGDLYKGGYGGQGLYVSPSRDLVIAFFGTADENMLSHDLKALARGLATFELMSNATVTP